MAIYFLQSQQTPIGTAVGTLTTGTIIKTLLQIKPSATVIAKIIEWGVSFDGSAAATPIKVELCETDVASTVTAFATADITKLDGNALAGGDPTTNLIVVGTSSSGYNASIQGTPTAVRLFDIQLVAPTNQYVKQFPLGREPILQISKFAQIRVTAGAAVNAYSYIILDI